MQCPNCGFENMPGLVACARCNAPLALPSATQENFLPPRAGRWRKLRKITYWPTRCYHVFPPLIQRFLRLETDDVSNGDICTSLLNIAPGLGYVFGRRKRAAIVAISIWSLLILLKILLYTGTTGGVLIGLIIAWHATIIFDAGRFRQTVSRLASRLMLMGLILFVTALSYRQVLRHTVNNLFTFITVQANIESRNLTHGDILLCRRNQALQKADKGDLLLMAERTGGWQHIATNVNFPTGHGELVGTLVARAGEEVVITPTEILVENLPIKLETLTDQSMLLLPRKEITIKIPEESIMVIFPLRVNMNYLRGANNQVVATVCQRLYGTTFIFKETEVIGHPIGIYAPLQNRRFFTQENLKQ